MLQHTSEETIRDQNAGMDGQLHDHDQRSIALAQYSQRICQGSLQLCLPPLDLEPGQHPSLSVMIVKKAKRGEYLLAIDVADHLLPVDGGQTGFYQEQTKKAAEEAQRLGSAGLSIKQGISA
ncbi:hypothetical protein CF327_g7027 [Tilletia walkeri]|nr:hypothetical protein CF327_g7027 [Tilletia walkeri]